ncbi:MAG TPA: PilZ domain-containing protein [Azospirillum sp.]|nr:PilZ domain-containing protein [Azospirillum sp.]
MRQRPADADRRRRPRFQVDEACTVTVRGRAQAGRAVNLSIGGAMLAGLDGLDAGERGTLRLERPGAEVGFEVRSRDADAVHVRFLETDPLLPAFQQAVARLTSGLPSASSAA